MRENYQNEEIDTSPPAVPEQVSVALAELAGEMRDGLLALAVGTGLHVMAAITESDLTVVCGPRGTHDRDRAAVRHEVPLSLVEGSTENTTLVIDSIVGLRERGLDVTPADPGGARRLEGAAPCRAGRVRPAVIARCQLLGFDSPRRPHSSPADSRTSPRMGFSREAVRVAVPQLTRPTAQPHPAGADRRITGRHRLNSME